MRKILALAAALLTLTAWTYQEAHDLANKTLVDVGESCSGTVIDKEHGYVATANHCTQKYMKVRMHRTNFPDGRVSLVTFQTYSPILLTQRKVDDFGDEIGAITYSSKVVAYDVVNDIAILQNISTVKFDHEVKITMERPKFGDVVYANTNPLMVAGAITKGQVFHPNFEGRIASTAIAAPGSSGGGLFNDKGEFIGIIVQIFATGSESFAVKNDHLKALMKKERLNLRSMP